MKRRRIRTWEDLESLPEGEWVEVAGLDFKVRDLTSGRRPAKVIIPLDPGVARSLRPKTGEILEAAIKGEQLVLVRRKAHRRRARSGGASTALPARR